MSNHRPADDPGASWASIATGTVLSLAALGASGYILWGPLDRRGLTGALLGLVLAILLAAQTIARIVDRIDAAERIRRHRDRDRRERERLERVARMEPPPSTALLLPTETEIGNRVSSHLYEEYPRERVEVREQWALADTEVFNRPDTCWTDDTGETRRLSYPAHQVNGPSAAALRPIAVPVFRSEEDRAAWADRHNLPTEVIPLYPEGWPEA